MLLAAGSWGAADQRFCGAAGRMGQCHTVAGRARWGLVGDVAAGKWSCKQAGAAGGLGGSVAWRTELVLGWPGD